MVRGKRTMCADSSAETVDTLQNFRGMRSYISSFYNSPFHPLC